MALVKISTLLLAIVDRYLRKNRMQSEQTDSVYGVS